MYVLAFQYWIFMCNEHSASNLMGKLSVQEIN